MDFSQKTVIVTGASSGIGAETAKRFGKEGARVVISYRANEKGAEETAEAVRAAGGEALVAQAELSSADDARALIEAALGKFGQIDILVNNAGGYTDGDEWNGTPEVWRATFEQNIISAMNASKYAIEHFRERQSGVIVSVSSRHGMMGQHDATAYAAAKAGVINITQAYAKLLAPYGRANAVSPGAVKTGYFLSAPEEEIAEAVSGTPLGELLEVGDVAEAVLFLASDKAKMITGHNLVVDGGYMLK